MNNTETVEWTVSSKSKPIYDGTGSATGNAILGGLTSAVGEMRLHLERALTAEQSPYASVPEDLVYTVKTVE